ncbi:MAG: AgmX/PglI C-terminal domain-containing protein [Nannocystis sp.]|uniref:VIT domain-containing protein n=1 Tax=Nannocystis sp. TaxID=1962667 RepID=UPI00242A210D|nr:VIT domain-containing protein [Nannocystis sp.]MBK9754448.1 AgmX/PglI C-terminal domain-containing protein [Nannocystis sp.]
MHPRSPLSRPSVLAPLLGLLACTPSGELGETPGDEHAVAAPDDAPGSDALAIPARPPRKPIQGQLVSSELPVDDDSRCADAAPAQDAAPIDPNSAASEGRMAVRKGDAWLGLPLRETRYDTVVIGTVAETSVIQVFHNPLPDRLEAIYNFPLPADAAVDDYWIRVDGREIRGVMKTRDDARRTYEAARDAGQSAALLEQNRPNLFAQAVANIPPGGTIEVEMHLVQPLRREQGRYRLLLPITVGPRYIPGSPDSAGNTAQVPDAAAIRSPGLAKGVVSCATVDIQVAIEAAFPLTALRSKYHALTVDAAGATTRLELARGSARPNRDFDLSWQLAGLEPRAQLMAQKTGDDGGYFTLAVEPPQAYPQDKARPRELVFALDTSGSMHGAPMATAVAAVKKALDGMGPDDTFQILRFAGDTSQLAEAPLRNTPANRALGLEFLTRLAGYGGTEMLAGIKAALERPADPERLRMVLFLTDGYIGNEVEVFAEIEKRRGDARLFGLGVGSSVNHYLLDGMSRIGRGAVTYVGPGEATDAVVERFYGYIGTPVLTDIEIDWGGLPVADVVPNALPDLFAGQPVVVYGRFVGAPTTGQATLKARLGGAPITMPLKLDLRAGQEHSGLASMWARQQVDALLGYPNLKHNGGDTSIIEQVTKLAISHRVMTEYTSFVAVERRPEKQPDGSLKTVEVPLELPQGVENSAYGEGTLGLGNYGLIGKGGGGGTGSGYGRGAGAGFGGRGTRVPTVRQAKAEVQGSLDKDIIRRIVRAHINEVRHCYNQGLSADPNLKGRVVIQFDIDLKGKVPNATVSEDTVPDKTVGACIRAALLRWTFPKPVGGVVTVSYPFVLEPG